eukprot:c27051_g2_i1 orf=240-665(-)
MDKIRNFALCNAWLIIVFVMVQLVLQTESGELSWMRVHGEKCSYEDRDSCNGAKEQLCVWCELSQECYHSGLVSKLGASCQGSYRRKLSQIQECGNIATEEKCRSLNWCQWCKSEVVDDGCFRDWEARRLPNQVFACAKVS